MSDRPGPVRPDPVQSDVRNTCGTSGQVESQEAGETDGGGAGVEVRRRVAEEPVRF